MDYIQKGGYYFTKVVIGSVKVIFWIIFSIAAIMLFLLTSDMYIRGTMTALMASVITGYIIMMSCFIISVIYHKRFFYYTLALVIIWYLAFVSGFDELSLYSL